MFYKLTLFTLIILIHEFGHAFAGFIFGWKLDKICIYPFGGCTKFDSLINSSFLSELIVLLFGPLFQIVISLVLYNYILYFNSIIFFKYNIFILFFNLLPIYPLDGGRLLNLFLNFLIPFKKTLKISIFISYFFSFCLFLLFWGNYSLLLFLSLILIIYNVFLEYKNINVLYNKFLLERLIYSFKFSKNKFCKNIFSMFKYKNNYMFLNNKFINEKKILIIYFKV